MALSWFSSKKSSEHTFPGKSSEAALVVRTMQDDLKNIESGEQEHLPPQPETEQYKSKGTSPETGVPLLAVNPFSEEGEELFQSRGKDAKNPQSNPFGVAPSRPNKPIPNFSQPPALENGLTPLLQRGELLKNQPTISGNLWLMGGVGAVTILFAVAGIWYLFFGNEEMPESDLPQTVIEQPSEIPGNLTPKESPFSKDLPNYLSLNTETVSPLDIQKTLSQAAERIKEADITEPIEFLITDQNNNPLAFSRFAFLLKLDLDSELLALVSEPFSLYAYNDAGHPRFGLVLTFKDAQAATAIIEKTEAGLPYALRALILEPDISVGKNLPFRSTNYNQFSVRFANIDSSQNISLDYAVDSSQLFVGMSKNTLRAILDASTK